MKREMLPGDDLRPRFCPPFAPILASLIIWAAILWTLGIFTGCTPDRTQLDPQKVAQAQARVTVLCGQAMALAPIAGPYAPFILGGCASEAAIGNLAAEPSSVEWLNGIIAKVSRQARGGHGHSHGR